MLEFFRQTTTTQKEVTMRIVKKDAERIKLKAAPSKARVEAYHELVSGEYEINHYLLMIQELIPLGLLAVEEALQQEVCRLAGERYSHDSLLKRWGSNPGSVYLGNQKLSIKVPRVRDLKSKQEVP